METKGINTTEQIDKFKQDNDVSDDARKELSLKSMLISCFCYGGIGHDTYNYERYILPYKDKMDDELFEEVYAEQSDFLQKCSVNHNVYTDCEGLTYNSLQSKNL